jgi:hypothetical protein
MICGKRISVLVTTCARYTTLLEVMKGWLGQSGVDDLWLLDCGGKLPSSLHGGWGRSVIWTLPLDPGTKTDYVMALLTEGDIIILADDDVLVDKGFVQDLYNCWAVEGGIIGIIGRTFHGPTYWGGTRFYRASLVSLPTRVGFAGVICMAGRELFGFDVRGCPRNCDDLWWQMKIHPDVPKHVAPTKRYKNLRVASDGTAMYKQPKLSVQREAFYREHYLKTYAPTGRTF